MAEYLVMIYANEESLARAGDEAMGKLMTDHNNFSEANGASLRGGNALEASSTATSLHKNSSGDVVATDGPFAETKEAIGGYYVIEANDLDAALAIAEQVPMPFGGVEVRPIRNMA